MGMSKLLRYFLPFIIGVVLGLVYLWFWQPQLLGLSKRSSLESGSIWTADETSLKLPTIDPTPIPSINILFAGDVMLDRHVRLQAQKDGYASLLSDPLKQLLQDQNIVVINLEGPVTQEPSVSLGSKVGSTNNYLFTFDPEAVRFLADHNMRLVNLGNNHITNFGQDGVISTLNYLYQAGIEHFGWVASSYELEEYNQEYLALELSGFMIGFVNFNQFSNQSFDSALELVRQMQAEVEYLIVYTHWGTEYAPEPNAVIKEQAHQLVDAGADLVIGSHPHVIQPFEDYQGKRIYYSLGNFIFDQYFSPEVQKGQLVQLDLKRLVEEDALVEGEVTGQLKPSFLELEVFMSSGEAVKLIEKNTAIDQTAD